MTGIPPVDPLLIATLSFQRSPKPVVLCSPSKELPWCLSAKESTCQCGRCGFDPWVRETPWKSLKGWPTPVCLPEKSHGQRSLVGYSPWGCQRVGCDSATKQTTTTTHPDPKCWSDQSLSTPAAFPYVHSLRICCFAHSLWLESCLLLFPPESQWCRQGLSSLSELREVESLAQVIYLASGNQELKVGFSDSKSKPNILFRMWGLPCLCAQHCAMCYRED